MYFKYSLRFIVIAEARDLFYQGSKNCEANETTRDYKRLPENIILLETTNDY